MLISRQYQEQIRLLHEQTKWGTGGKHFAHSVIIMTNLLGIKTVLDYGAGREALKHSLDRANSGLDVRCYDPGIPEISTPPEPAGLVVCTDVLEHVEEEYLTETLRELDRLATKAILLQVAVSPSKAFLPDGRNAHLTVHPYDWWEEKLTAWWPGKLNCYKSMGFFAWGLRSGTKA